MRDELLKTMIREHNLIETLLNEFERVYILDSSKAEKIFSAFMWNLEKHMFLEEKIIYNTNSLWDGSIEEIFEILGEHGEILFLAEKIRAFDFTEEDVSSLKELLNEHFANEEIVLYPKFEKRLNEEQKSLFLERITEMLVE